MPVPADQTAEFGRWLQTLPRERVEVFVADPSTAVEAGLEWVRPMLRTNDERIVAHALYELRERDAAQRRRERRREEIRWAITTLVALASLATSAAVALRG
jgi:hypothetical protein